MLSQKTHSDLEWLQSIESNARTYARTINRVISQGTLARVRDTENYEYIDCLACAGALPLGHNHPFVTERIMEFLRSGHIWQGLDIATPAKIEFVRRLYDALPAAFSQDAKIQFCGPSGSDAVEAAIKLFKTATGRRSVLAFHGAYHGMTMGALSLMGNTAPKAAVSGYMSEVHFLPFPNAYRCPFGIGGSDSARLSLNYIENLLKDPESGITKPALIILEAIQGEGGCIPASSEWLCGLRELATEHDIPLVIDEVQTGFGRTGTMFAHELAGIVPDAIIMSKAVGGGFPLSVLAFAGRYDKWNPGAHAGTFRGNQIALVSGAATIEYLSTHDIPRYAAKIGEVLRTSLEALKSSHNTIGDVRGRGLMIGVELINPLLPPDRYGNSQQDGNLARRVKLECLKKGLIVETGGRHGSVVRFLPPLIISELDVAEIVRRFSSALCDAQMIAGYAAATPQSVTA